MTGAQLAYLAALLRADLLIGLPDPFRGLLADEIAAALGQARAELTARGWLTPLPDGTLRIDDAVADAVRVCGAPRSSLRVRDQSGGLSYIHLSEQMAVELAAVEGPDQYRLSPLGTPAELVHLLADRHLAIDWRSM